MRTLRLALPALALLLLSFSAFPVLADDILDLEIQRRMRDSAPVDPELDCIFNGNCPQAEQKSSGRWKYIVGGAVAWAVFSVLKSDTSEANKHSDKKNEETQSTE